MPYIPQSRRETNGAPSEQPGDLHYDISQLIDGYLYHQPRGDGQLSEPNYQRFNDVLGVLAAASHEMYRRLVVPYEDMKLFENGEVYSVSQHDELNQCLDASVCRCSE